MNPAATTERTKMHCWWPKRKRRVLDLASRSHSKPQESTLPSPPLATSGSTVKKCLGPCECLICFWTGRRSVLRSDLKAWTFCFPTRRGLFQIFQHSSLWRLAVEEGPVCDFAAHLSYFIHDLCNFPPYTSREKKERMVPPHSPPSRPPGATLQTPFCHSASPPFHLERGGQKRGKQHRCGGGSLGES